MFKPPLNTALNGIIVVEYADESASFCLETLAGLGALVVKAEPQKASAGFLEQIRKADAFVETAPPGFMSSLGFGYETLHKMNPRLVWAGITPFGQTGPYREYKASDGTLQALGGWLSVTGTPEKPLLLPGNQAYHTASLFAVNAILMALWARGEKGQGCYIDISIFECVAAALDHVLVRYYYEGIVSGRSGARAWNNAFDVLPCKDGYVLISIHRQWETLVELLAGDGMAEDLADVGYKDRDVRNLNIAHILEVMGRWTQKHTAAELEATGQLMHFPWAAVSGSAL